MKVSLILLLLLFGAQSAQASFWTAFLNFINSIFKRKPSGPACTHAITRVNKATHDYVTTVETSENYWSDPDFPADRTSLQWSNYKTNELSDYLGVKWGRLGEICPSCTMFGT